MKPIEVDIWIRGTQHASTHTLNSVSAHTDNWSEADVEHLLTEMLRAVEREKNPGGEPPPVTLRGFSWIVSPYEEGGVVVHLEMQIGTASAGPFQIDADRLTAMIRRAMQRSSSVPSVH